MDLTTLAQAIDKMLQESANEAELLSEITSDGAVWGFEMEEDVSGFISCETNAGTGDVATVSISLSLGSTQGLDRDDLLELLLINGEMLDAHITVTPPFEDSPEQFLLMQRKLPAERFDPREFNDNLELVKKTADLFFNE
ncbi:MAG: hypothetical protein ACLFTB_00495 [Desulfovibrionales bacterium]